MSFLPVPPRILFSWGVTVFVCVCDGALILTTRTFGIDDPSLVSQEAVCSHSEVDC